MNFSVGDIVQLKSGGPEMTIIGVDTDGGKLQLDCAWSEGETQHNGRFPPEALKTPSDPTPVKAQAPGDSKKLQRSTTNRWIAGVCGGMGKYFGVDPTVVRLAWVIVTLLTGGVPILVYIAAWIVLARDGR
jgi:phage shock protein C